MLRSKFSWVTAFLLLSIASLGLAQSTLPKPVAVDGVSWIYVREKGSIHLRNLAQQKGRELQEKVPGEFLWFHENGKSYFIKDPSALSTLRKLSLESRSSLLAKPEFPVSSQDESKLKALKEHSQLLRKQADEFHDTVLNVSRIAIQQGLAEPTQLGSGSE